MAALLGEAYFDQILVVEQLLQELEEAHLIDRWREFALMDDLAFANVTVGMHLDTLKFLELCI